jgi:hypothetical protein
VMTKDNIGLAALLQTKEGAFEAGIPRLVTQVYSICIDGCMSFRYASGPLASTPPVAGVYGAHPLGPRVL